MRRTELVVPAGLVSRLNPPPRAVTDGTTAPAWVEVPAARWRFPLEPSLWLPLDRRTARSVRLLQHVEPWTTAALLVGVAFLAMHLDAAAGLAAAVFAAVNTLLVPRWASGLTPSQRPYRTRSGEVHIPDVPVDVAQEWIARNPGVTTTDTPGPARHPRRPRLIPKTT
ncbi:hypothetical protein KOI35_21050 [Actinoplanes bogorensis]|uniref:Uncharacterized protein n=1 Tax=Paractinoplanes bogorensis TaxID=1610840 RepID=A0ABS5YTJ5_9ACTN|nr:hypothetical protein [Actinoplanes bogorensis]MBU2666004.1 hypothetical protein [Actinoplanes bogorensis]